MTTGQTSAFRPIRLLLVEDNPADVDLTREKMNESKILHELYAVMDGVEAMEFLTQQGQYANSPRPDLVLLDLNLPRKNGREVLEEIKANPRLETIPVVVLTSSQAEEDVIRAYKLQASAYVTKPVDLKGFARIVKGIESFWFTVVRFPQQ